MIGIPILVVCYVLGGIPFGVIIGKLLKGIDIRDFGSGNIGASNVLRTLGTGPALVVFFFDTIKGYVAVVLCEWFFINVAKVGGLWPYWVVAGSLICILGHTFSIFLKFQGGKGVATSLGVIIGLNWLVAAIALGIWLVLVGVTRYISVASILASISVPLQMVFWKSLNVPSAYQMLAGLAALVIVLKHTTNIKRLLAGKEPRVGQQVKVDNSGSI